MMDRFYYQVHGPENARKWVFLHGLMGFAANWRKITRALENTERTLAYDQRGHGRSFKPSQGFGPYDYSHDLLAILDHLGWDRIVLVGHSMGGRNALAFASEHPERIEKLIIEDIGPEAQPENYLHFQKLLGQVPAPFRSREEAKHFLFGEFVKNFQGHEDPRVMADYFYANMTETSEGTVSWRFSPEAIVATAREGRMQDYWGLVENLSVPTLWIRGENSVELPKAVYERVLAMNSRIMGHVIQDAAHWVHADQPEAFIKIIKEFVGVPSNISYKAPKE